MITFNKLVSSSHWCNFHNQKVLLLSAPIALWLVRRHIVQLHSQRPEFDSRLEVLCWSCSPLSTQYFPVISPLSSQIKRHKKNIHFIKKRKVRKHCYCYCFSTFEWYYIMVLRASLLTHVALFHTTLLVKCWTHSRHVRRQWPRVLTAYMLRDRAKELRLKRRHIHQ